MGSTATRELRLAALNRLGGKCSISGCEWTHPDVLEIDHIKPVGDGKLRISNRFTYLIILKMTHPEDEYQLLCACHHNLKTVRDLEDILEFRAQTRGVNDLQSSNKGSRSIDCQL